MRPRPEPAPRRDARPPQRPHRDAREHREGREHREVREVREHREVRERRDGSGAAWFSINVGRSKNADPKWLIPLLCRRGNISKREIGKIQILARETRVEIAPDAAPAFAEAVRRPDPKDRNIHIEPLDAAP
jgi:ATP-dependent RNA helicase DeaD